MMEYVKEARIAVEAAIALAELVAQTEITQSQSFNQMVIYLHDALEVLARAEGDSPPDEHTIFPSQESADKHLANIQPCGNIAYGRGRQRGPERSADRCATRILGE